LVCPFFSHVVLSVAYPNLLGTKRLGCCCCCILSKTRKILCLSMKKLHFLKKEKLHLSQLKLCEFICFHILNPLLKRIPHLIYYNNGNLLIQASCRRNFILEVVLTNAFGEPVKDREVLF
jgi:hypothetical protein